MSREEYQPERVPPVCVIANKRYLLDRDRNMEKNASEHQMETTLRDVGVE